MPLNRMSDLDRITNVLSHIKSKVEISNPSNFMDININAENFFRDFLNIVFNYRLVNMNIVEPNIAAIDLGDEHNRIAFQITSTSDLTKAKKTVKKFNDRNLHKKYDHLIVLNIAMKKRHKKQLIGDATKHQLNTASDIWDISDLIKKIGNMSVSDISAIRSFLEDQVPLRSVNSVSEEIETFQALITLLSDESHRAASQGFIAEPDPQRKIENRFSDHAVFLKDLFKRLYTEYGKVMSDVFESEQLDQVQLRRLGIYLRDHSDRVLTENSGDAKKALDVLVHDYGERLSSYGAKFNSTAISFFLVSELIKCNVFPNKEMFDA